MPTPLAIALLDGQPEWTEIVLVVGLALLLASVVSTAVARLVRLALYRIYGGDEHSARLVGRPVLIVRFVTFLLAFPVTLLPLLDAIGERLDTVEARQPRDIDEAVRTRYPALHQVEQVGAGREIRRTRLGCGRDGVGDGGRPEIIESLHAERL